MQTRPTVMLRRDTATFLLLTGLVLVGCDAPTPTSDGPPETVTYPTGPDDVVLRVQTCCGMTTATDVFATQPEVVITDNGTVYVGDPNPRSSLLDQVRTGRLTDSEIEDLMTEARDAGLLGPAPDYDPGEVISDASGTRLLLRTTGGSFEHEAYALGYTTGESDSAAREKLAEFVAHAEEITLEAATDPWTTDRLRLISFEMGEEEAGDSWPAGAPDLAELATCTEVTSAALVKRLGKLPNTARFAAGRRQYEVGAAYVLPGEDCATRKAP